MDLTNNWWGNTSGPSGVGFGSGDSIANLSGGVTLFSPWLTEGTISECGDTSNTNEPPVISRTEPDTLLNGRKELFLIEGNNFISSGISVALSRGGRGEPDPGDVQGTIKLVTSQTLLVELDITNSAILGNWDLVVKNSDSLKASKTLFVIPSIIASAYNIQGIFGYPVGTERANYMEIFNFGNDNGWIFLEFTPPAPGIIDMKIGDFNAPLWEQHR